MTNSNTDIESSASGNHTEKEVLKTEQHEAQDVQDEEPKEQSGKYQDQDQDQDDNETEYHGNDLIRKFTSIPPSDEEGEEKAGEFNENNELFPYCVLSKNLIMMTMLICGFEGLLSTISSPAFFGCLDQVKKQFGIDDETVNMAIVVYFIFQGISPTCVSYLVDSNYLGKRNTVLIGCIVYGTTNIGIANAKNFGTILGLRCIQSFFISPVIAINSSIVGDITKKENRGNIMGLVSGFQVCAGSAFGAVISAGLTNQFGWTGIFYYLAILGYCSAGIVFFFLPETTRVDVGNGSLVPRRIIDRAPITYTRFWKKKVFQTPYPESVQPIKRKGFFSFIDILKKREVVILLLASGMQFCLWTCHLTSISTVLSGKHYNLSTLTIGKCYLPSGVCTLISIVSAGRLLNWNFKRRKDQYDAWIKTQEGNEDFDLSLPKYKFNIYKARLEFANAPMIISGASFIICAWLMETKQSLAAILVFSGLGCLFSNCILTFSITLIIDLHPFAGSTAAGVINLSRCLLSALFVGCLQFMFKSLGVGGTFVLITGISVFFSALLYYSISHALQWQYDREQKQKLEASKAN